MQANQMKCNCNHSHNINIDIRDCGSITMWERTNNTLRQHKIDPDSEIRHYLFGKYLMEIKLTKVSTPADLTTNTNSPVPQAPQHKCTDRDHGASGVGGAEGTKATEEFEWDFDEFAKWLVKDDTPKKPTTNKTNDKEILGIYGDNKDTKYRYTPEKRRLYVARQNQIRHDLDTVAGLRGEWHTAREIYEALATKYPDRYQMGVRQLARWLTGVADKINTSNICRLYYFSK